MDGQGQGGRRRRRSAAGRAGKPSPAALRLRLSERNGSFVALRGGVRGRRGVRGRSSGILFPLTLFAHRCPRPPSLWLPHHTQLPLLPAPLILSTTFTLTRGSKPRGQNAEELGDACVEVHVDCRHPPASRPTMGTFKGRNTPWQFFSPKKNIGIWRPIQVCCTFIILSSL